MVERSVGKKIAVLALIWFGALARAEAIPTSQWSSGDSSSVTLFANSFWSTSTQNSYSSAVATEVASLLSSMDAGLKKTSGLNGDDRAKQLQWALYVANHLSSTSVTVVLPPGTYDFSSIAGAHADTPSDYHLAYSPKLFVARDNVTIKAEDLSHAPLLTYSGPGDDGVNHGRVLLLVPSNRVNILVRGLRFRGDHHVSHIFDPAYYLHENAKQLLSVENKILYGLLMVGLAGGPNDTVVDNCSFEALNFNAIELKGNLRVTNSNFQGIVPRAGVEKDDLEAIQFQALFLGAFPAEDKPETSLIHNDYFSEKTYAITYVLDPYFNGQLGMQFEVGLSQKGQVGSVTLTGSTFANLNEGISASPGMSWDIERNRFSDICDHAIYLLGEINGGVIADNTFQYIYKSAMKLGGNAPDVTFSLSGPVYGPHLLEVARNSFSQIARGIIRLSGSFNYIHDNLLATYRLSTDTSEGFYDPAGQGQQNYPHLWANTDGGQSNWYNHTAYNRIEDNVADSGKFLIYLAQSDTGSDTRDRSISLNRFSGAGEQVYVNFRVDSRFEKLLSVDQSTELHVGAPVGCTDCEAGAADFYRDADGQLATAMRSRDAFTRFQQGYLAVYGGQ